MCGIAGIFNYGSTPTDDRTIACRMRDMMPHRGPDGSGLYQSPDRRLVLAHRRLSIVDLSAAGHQPMANEDGTVWVTFNGEIYNHQEQRAALAARGHRFRSQSDTEVIVHAYEEWGRGCLSRLDGMFAFALWDARRRELLMARDRLGKKPVYYAIVGGRLLFASEIKALLVHPDVARDIDPIALDCFLTFSNTPAPLTMFKNVFKLPAAHLLRCEPDGGVRIERYWSPLDGDAWPAANGKDSVERVRALIERSVCKRLMSDVPVGAFLSGGVDSSTNVALMSRFTDRPVETFTVGFRDFTHLNELDHARRIAREFRTSHHEVLIGEREMMDYLPDLIFHQDEPIADWVCIPLYFVSRLVRQAGTIVVQVGEGADEQFCGYDGYMAYLRLHRRYWGPFGRLPAAVQRGAAALARAGAGLAEKGDLYADIVDRAARRREHFWGGAVVFWELMKQRLVRPGRFDAGARVPAGLEAMLPGSFFQPDSFAVVRHYLAEFDRAFPGADVLTRMIYLEFKLRLPELLLMRVDKISMSTSIEARVPFLDHKLVEFSMGIPMRLKVKGSVPKYILKKSCEGIIPDDVIYRKKMGFGAPMSEWLRGDFGAVAEATITESPLRREGYFDDHYVRDLFRRHRAGQNHGLPIWTLYNLTAWFDRWVAGRPRR
jgi:asparagine synthase (glutamine-hydrolysing)